MADGTRQVSVQRLIKAPAARIFEILASPAGHVAMDGSGTVRGNISGPDHLVLGSKFHMSMKMFRLPYRVTSKVVEFEQDRLIAWAHFGKHRWRFELEPSDGATLVRHTFDWSTATSPRAIELFGYPKSHPAHMEKTLERLESLVTEGPGG